MTTRSRLVVIGNGMAGARFVEDVVGQRRRRALRHLGVRRRAARQLQPHPAVGRARRHAPHGRHRHQPARRGTPTNGVTLHAGVRVERLDLAQPAGDRRRRASIEPYDTLVHRDRQPPAAAADRRASCTTTARSGTARSSSARSTTASGCWRARATRAPRWSSAAGCSASRPRAACCNHGLEVHVVHLTPHVMDAQLDPTASRILQRQLERMGLHVLTGAHDGAILGDDRVERRALRGRLDARLRHGRRRRRHPAERPARAGGGPRRSAAASSSATTSRARARDGVYAIGECAEHRGQLYGLVAPLWEQAQVLADRLTGRRADARLRGLAALDEAEGGRPRRRRHGPEGAADEDDEVVSYAEPSRGIYKKLIVRNDRLVGAILIGDGPLVPGASRRRSPTDGRWRTGARSCSSRSPIDVPRPRARADAGRRADLRLQRRVEGADRRRGAARREQPAGGLRRDARRHRLRLVPARGRSGSSRWPA